MVCATGTWTRVTIAPWLSVSVSMDVNDNGMVRNNVGESLRLTCVGTTSMLVVVVPGVVMGVNCVGGQLC